MQDVEKWFLLVWAHFTPKCKVSYDIVTQYYCSMLYKYKDSWNRNERFLNTQKTSQLLKKGSSAKSRKNSSCCHENFCCLEKEPWTHRSQKHSEKISTRRLRTTIMNDATHIFSELFCVIPNFDCHRSLLCSSTDGFTEEFPVYVPIMPVRSSAVGFQFWSTNRVKPL